MNDLEAVIREWMGRTSGVDIETASKDTLLDLREQGRELEQLVSYARRLVQTRLDFAMKEEISEEAYREIVSRPVERNRAGRNLAFEFDSDDLDLVDSYLAQRIGPEKSYLLDRLSPEELQEYQERLATVEKDISRLRRELQDLIDRIGGELMKRYRAEVTP
jgi:vacuolar-type H+-ATPase subunit I/STV1